MFNASYDRSVGTSTCIADNWSIVMIPCHRQNLVFVGTLNFCALTSCGCNDFRISDGTVSRSQVYLAKVSGPDIFGGPRLTYKSSTSNTTTSSNGVGGFGTVSTKTKGSQDEIVLENDTPGIILSRGSDCVTVDSAEGIILRFCEWTSGFGETMYRLAQASVIINGVTYDGGNITGTM